MDLWQLQVFCKVVEEKSFSRAGKRIRLSQPTISSHIKELETHFGCRLIDRLAREALPTRAGELLYTYARRLITLRDEAESAMADFQGKMKGTLAVGGSTIPGGYLLPKKLGAFTKNYPEIRISLTIAGTETIISGILKGDLEIGIVGAQAATPQVAQEQLIDDEMLLIIPAGHPWSGRRSVTLNMLRKEPFIAREQGSGTLKSIELSLGKAGGSLEELNTTLRMGSTVSVVQAIKGGAGVSILSKVAVSEDLETGRLAALRIEGVDLRRSFYLTRLKHRSVSPIGRAFIEFLEQAFDQHPST
jgi:DNA-binding transcriptional LysR family regulator